MSKIQRNKVVNLKALSEFEADFGMNGSTAILTGANNSGKSSFLRSLIDRLNNVRADVVLKTGTSEGMQELTLTTGEQLIWEFNNKTAKGERLIFVTKDQSGKELKMSLTEEIARRFFPPGFDIDGFLHAQPKKQKKILEDVTGLDFTAINDRYKIVYEDRTLANSKLKDAKANPKPIDPTLPVKEIDIEPIQLEISGIELHNHKFEQSEKGVTELKKQITPQETEIKRLETLLKTAKEGLKTLEKRVTDGEKWLSEAKNKPKDKDVAELLGKKLQDAKDKNEKIKKNNEAIKAKDDLLQLDIKAKEADKKVKAIELEKVEMIKKSNLPEGFEFGDDQILFNGLPITKEQLSSSSIYIAALKLAAINLGEVKTLYFDASMLDRNSLAEVEKWAVSEGTKRFGEPLQLLIERVDYEAGDLRYELVDETK